MIQLKTDGRVSIILPNTNKALAEALKNATPEQLSTLKEGKDVRSLLTSLFQDKTTSAKSDQMLLDILKNAPAFKQMGNFSDNLGGLIKELKSSPELAAKTEILTPFVKQASAISAPALQTQLLQSGVFMESKIARALETLPLLKQTLEALETLLVQSNRPPIKEHARVLGELLKNPVLAQTAPDPKNAAEANFSPSPKAAAAFSEALRGFVEGLRGSLAKNDLLYARETAALVDRLVSIAASLEPLPTPPSPQAAQEVKTALGELYTLLLRSSDPASDTLLDSIESLLRVLRSPSAAEATLQNGIERLAETFETLLASADVSLSEELPALLAQIAEFTDPEALNLDTLLEKSLGSDLKARLLTLSEELQASPDPKAAELREHVDRLLTQIDYHQLLSGLGNSTSVYFPFAWEMLEEGSLGFKKSEGKKFYCEINLRLKEYGELNLMMALYDETQIEIQAHTQNPEFKTLLTDNVAELRSLLIDAGLTPRRIRIADMKESLQTGGYDDHGTLTDHGFEVTV
ncbi:MAG: flagellar hook-length control protein FliK [Campylobacterota bacterium]